mgnify:FL=1
MFVARLKGQGRPDEAGQNQERAAAATAQARPRRWLGYVIALSLIVSALAGYGLYWWNYHEPVTVRVTDTQSRETVTYEVYKGSIVGRTFRTTDGVAVTVSDTERLEVERE